MASLASVSVPAAVAGNPVPPGPADGEFLCLQYPLSNNAAWTIREDPLLVEAWVAGHEGLKTPAGKFSAVEVRIQNELFEPGDTASFWYGRCGELARAADLAVTVVDPVTGEVLGEGLFRERWALIQVDLEDRPCGNRGSYGRALGADRW